MFEQELWEQLTQLAKKQKVSVGQIVRTAAKEKVAEEKTMLTRKNAIDHILKIRPAPSKTPIDYKALINHGRKY